MEETLLRVSSNFSRGLNSAISHTIDIEEVQASDNFLFDEGTPVVREGYKRNASLPYGIATLQKVYLQNGSSYFAAFAGGQLYVSTVSGVFSRVSSIPISGDIFCAVYDDVLYFTNYSNPIQFYDGSRVDGVGISSPSFYTPIGSFENISGFNVSATSGTATIALDLAPNHIDDGNAALLFSVQGQATYTLSGVYNLNKFTSDISSDENDIITLFTVHDVKAWISSIVLGFVGTSSRFREKEITSLSSWNVCPNDSFSLIHVIPKSMFSATSGVSIWTSCTPYIRILSASSGPALVTVDNLRMLRTPPIVGWTSSNYSTFIYYGSSNIGSKGQNRFDNTTVEIVKRGIAFEGTTVSGIVIQDGLTYYKVTFLKTGPYNRMIESNPCYQTSGVKVSNTPYPVITTMSSIPVAPDSWNVIGRGIYRRNYNTSSFQFVQMIHNNSGTTFIDRVPLTTLGQELDEMGHWPPPNSKYIYMASNQRMYFYNLMESDGPHGSRVRYSQVYQPHYVPLENAFDINPGDGTQGTGIFEFMGMVHFLKERSTWILDPSTGMLQQVHSALGCAAPKSIAMGPEHVFWLSDQGVIMYNLRFRTISKEGMRVDSIIKDLPKTYLKNAVGIHFNNFYLLAVTQNAYGPLSIWDRNLSRWDLNGTESYWDQGNPIFNDTVLVYDILNDIWSVFPDIYLTCFTTWRGSQDGLRLFFGDHAGGLYEFLTGDDDDGYAIYSRLRTKEFGFNSPTMALQQLHLYTEAVDGNSRAIQVKPYYDWTYSSGDSDYIYTSGEYGVGKIRFPGKDGASFFSAEFISSGRFRIMRCDLYGKAEGLR